MNGLCGCLMGAAAGKEETLSSRSDRSTVQNDMYCEACTVRFSVLKRKKNCLECTRNYCAHCAPKIKSGNGRRCERCQFLVAGSFSRADLQDYKAKDIRLFLTKRKIPVDNCREKADLIDVLMAYSNNAQYRLEQQENEMRKRQLQAQARENLRSPPHRPEPPAYNTIYDQSSSGTTEPRVSSDQTQSRDQTDPHVPSSRDSGNSTDTAAHNQRQSNTGASSSYRSNESNGGQSDNPSNDMPMDFDDSHFAQEREGQNSGRENEETEPNVDNNETRDNNSSSSIPQPNVPTPSADSIKPSTDSPASSPARKKLLLSDVTSEEEITSLTSRQLKELLERNFVNYKGCVEKHELVTRVTRLWHEHQRNQEEAEKINSGTDDQHTGNTDMCKICMDAVVDCVLLDCGHMLTCTACGKQLAECPICRQYVVRVVHVFKS